MNAGIPANDKYWVNNGGAGDNTWNDTLNWASSASGVGGAGVPDSGSTVYFDGTDDDDNCTLDVNVNVKSIDIQENYTGIFDLDDFNLTTSDDFTVGKSSRVDNSSVGTSLVTVGGDFLITGGDGTEVVGDGTFDTDCGVNWTCETGWTIGATGKASFDGSGNGTSYQLKQDALVANKYHEVTFTISDYTSGDINCQYREY